MACRGGVFKAGQRGALFWTMMINNDFCQATGRAKRRWPYSRAYRPSNFQDALLAALKAEVPENQWSAHYGPHHFSSAAKPCYWAKGFAAAKLPQSTTRTPGAVFDRCAT